MFSILSKTTRALAAGALVLIVVCTFGRSFGYAQDNTQQPKKVLVIGAHPDDPETGCGGTIAVLKLKGYDVVCVYLTRGERGIPGKTLEEAAAIRTKEAEEAAKILGVRHIFLTQIDGATEINKERYDEMLALIKAEKPDIVFTHWPIDGHRDHRICSVLTYDSWRRTGYAFDLYYFEVMTGVQTQNFHPDVFVDISAVRDIKHKSCYAHKSQFLEQGEDVMKEWHMPMEVFRGLESQHAAAEAFVKQVSPAESF